jgi:hypothetical protein
MSESINQTPCTRRDRKPDPSLKRLHKKPRRSAGRESPYKCRVQRQNSDASGGASGPDPHQAQVFC